MTDERFVILCAAAESALAGALRSVVDMLTDHQFDVEALFDDEELHQRLDELDEDDIRVPLVLASDRVGEVDGITALAALRHRPSVRGVRTLLVTRRLDEAGDAVGDGAIDAFVPVPWDQQVLEETIDHLITGYLIEEDPAALEQVPEIVDVELLSHAFTRAEERGRSARVQLEAARRGLLAHTELSDDEVEEAMVREIEAILDHPDPQVYPAGTLLLESGQEVDGITIVLDGQINLSLDVEGTETSFHVRTAGRILGILALAHHEPALFTARAVTDVTAIPLTVDQLDDALQRSSTLSGLFMSVLLRSMVRRIRRSVELRIDLDEARQAIAAERDQLALALQQLDQAQSQLIEQEKMALLGQLVAGVAHELNNPIAAILRATDYIEEDITSLTTRHPESQRLTDTLIGALHAEPVSTRTERAQRRELAGALGDDVLAGRLVHAGITTRADVDRLFAGVPEPAKDDLLTSVEAYRRLGTAIRNLRTGGRRIEGLVGSLRSYARRPEDTANDVDVREGLDETLLLLGHRMREITVERRYDPVPMIAARAGELNQVWTNLIVNAIQVMEGPGTLEVVTDVPEPGFVRVQVIDSGPGIPPEDVERIFDLAFTTKQGRVDFGLGLGLRIALDIVTRHHGVIEVDSVPGRTAFSVTLPVGNTTEGGVAE
ncbi:MAG: ATP-binding protein [Acidimicrobiia bacterium]|nr:ATP-binding protein [Acidimicrobiia bacterium]